MSRPIFIAGSARSGTTWVGSILATAMGAQYVYEPFSPGRFAAMKKYDSTYLRGSDQNDEFLHYCREVFGNSAPNSSGDVVHVVKDVATTFALDFIRHHIAPRQVIVVRHPCDVVSSWKRLQYSFVYQLLGHLLSQRTLLEDHLHPFEAVLRNARGFVQSVAAYWGAANYVMLRQFSGHPECVVLRHEILCQDPRTEFGRVFNVLGLGWTDATTASLENGTQRDSGRPYVPQRISTLEPGKWRRELDATEIRDVLDTTSRFDLPLY